MTSDGWDKTALELVAEVAIGKTPARNEKSFWDPGKTTQNRWATIADIQSRYISETRRIYLRPWSSALKREARSGWHSVDELQANPRASCHHLKVHVYE